MADFDDPERGRYTIPLLMGVMIALYAGSRIEELRRPEATILALGCAPVCAWFARQPFAESSGPIRVAAELGAALTVLVALGRSVLALSGDPALGVWSRLVWLDLASAAIGLAALGVDYGARRYAIRSRYAAWLGFALVAASQLSRRAGDGDRFGAIFGALFVGFLAGGGAGLLLGAWLQHLARPTRA